MLYISFMRYLFFKFVGFAALGLVLGLPVGNQAPNLELHDLKGVHHKLEEYRGKPVVLNFWATWCVPCATEMPLLNEMQQRYQGRALFIAASVDDDDLKPAIKAFVKKHGGGALTIMLGGELDNLNDFGLEQVMPGTVFIDRDGNIVGRASGGLKRADLEERMKNLAGEPGPTASAPATKKKKSAK